MIAAIMAVRVVYYARIRGYDTKLKTTLYLKKNSNLHGTGVSPA